MKIPTDEKVPLVLWETNLFYKAIEKWGEEAQLRQLQEEAAELIVVINHLLRGRDTWEHVCEEMSDVKILVDQISLIDNNNELMNKYRTVKLNRLKERLEK